MLMDKVSVAPGRSGNVEIARFDVEDDIQSRRLALAGRAIVPGRYTKLLIGGRLMMSDTPAEMRDHWPIHHHAKGRVLITGLGLGMIANAVARKPDVDEVTIIESNPDVIALVSGSLHDKCSVIEADAFAYAPPKGAAWDAAWHDIWFDLCTDNLPEMTRLKRRFARRSAWQGCWGEELLRAQVRRERRNPWAIRT